MSVSGRGVGRTVARTGGRGFCAALATVLLAAALPPRAGRASPRSAELVAQGYAELSAGRDAAALGSFDEAAAADPSDADAAFFAGLALNQLGRHADALDRLALADRLGSTRPEVDLERARALVNVGRPGEALRHLDRFEASSPGVGQASGFRGRALMALRRHDEASAAFDEALRRDPSLADTVLPYQAAVAAARQDERAARDRLRELVRIAPNSATAREAEFALSAAAAAASSDARAAQPSDAAKPWDAYLSLAVGYDTDARRLEQASAQASSPSGESFYEQVAVGGSRTFTLGPADALTVGADLVVENYPELDDADLFNPAGHVELQHAFSERLWVTLRVDGAFEALGWDGFSTRVAGRAAVDWAVTDELVAELAVTGAYTDYLFPVRPVADPDAHARTVSADAFWSPPGGGLTLRAGAAYTRSGADGNDFDYHGWSVVAGASVRLPWELTAEVLYSHADDRYRNANSLTADIDDPLQLPQYRRRDAIDVLVVRLTRPVGGGASAFATYAYVRDDSNIEPYDFDQHVVSAGVRWDF